MTSVSFFFAFPLSVWNSLTNHPSLSTVHWMAIVPWFAFLFGLLSGIELVRASNEESKLAPAKTHTRFVQDVPSASVATKSFEKDDKSDSEDEKVRDGAEQV